MFGRRKRSQGVTLLEVVASAALLAVTLVPALKFMRDAVNRTARVETQQLLATYCASKLDEQLCRAAATFTAANAIGDCSADGYPQIKYWVYGTTDPASGGIANQLMAVYSFVWQDLNGNSTYETGEPYAWAGGAVAKMSRYQ